MPCRVVIPCVARRDNLEEISEMCKQECCLLYTIFSCLYYWLELSLWLTFDDWCFIRSFNVSLISDEWYKLKTSLSEINIIIIQRVVFTMSALLCQGRTSCHTPAADEDDDTNRHWTWETENWYPPNYLGNIIWELMAKLTPAEEWVIEYLLACKYFSQLSDSLNSIKLQSTTIHWIDGRRRGGGGLKWQAKPGRLLLLFIYTAQKGRHGFVEHNRITFINWQFVLSSISACNPTAALIQSSQYQRPN